MEGRGNTVKFSNKDSEKIEDIGLKKYLYIQFNRDDPLRLPSKRVFEGQIKQENKADDNDNIIKWTIRKEFTIALSPGNFKEDMIAPFNLLNFKLTLHFEDIDVLLSNGDNVKFKFNCMKRVGSEIAQ